MGTSVFGLFSIVEYLIGGIGFLSIYWFLNQAFLNVSLSFPSDLDSLAISSAIIIAAYVIGIILDNLGKIVLKGCQIDTDPQEENYNDLLNSNKTYLIARALRFEATKRVMRMTTFALILAPIFSALPFDELQINGSFLFLYVLGIIISYLVYRNIQQSYEGYLKKIKTQYLIKS